MSTVNEQQPTTSTTATDLASYQQFALDQQAQNNAWSAEQAQKQMDFQREMSNTAHQREVNDLKAAGLNPILSVNSGASVPNGAAGDTDTSAAGNVGAILQQVLQAQSAREVAGMYNAATLAAASIAANASMYGSDMAYWNAEDHPKTAEEMAARALLATAGGIDHSPSSGNTGPHSAIPGQNIGQNGSSYYSTQNNKYRSGSLLDRLKNLIGSGKGFTWTKADFDRLMNNPSIMRASRNSNIPTGAIFSSTGRFVFYVWLKKNVPNVKLTSSNLFGYMQRFLASSQGKAYMRAWQRRNYI